MQIRKFFEISLLFTALFAIGCGKKSITASVPVKKSVDALSAKTWCSLKRPSHSLAIVERITISGDSNYKTLVTEYMDVTAQDQIAIYPQALKETLMQAKRIWIPVDVIDKKSEFFADLKDEKDKIAAMHKIRSGLSLQAQDFAPVEAIQVRRVSGNTVYFPCSSFGKEFEATSPVRPLVNLAVRKAQEGWKHSLYPNFPSKIHFKLPLTRLSINSGDLQGGHWCSWKAFSPKQLTLKKLYFAEKKYSSGHYIGLFGTAGTEFDDFLSKIPQRLSWSDYSIGNETVYSASSPQGEEAKIYAHYALMMDAKGEKFLLKQADSISFEIPTLDADDFYLPCDDPRALEEDEFFRANLSKIMQVEEDAAAAAAVPSSEVL